MATAGGRPAASVVERLRQEPYRFDFFQAVRVLQTEARRLARDPRFEKSSLIGDDGDPRREPLRFTATASLSFPAAPVTRFVEQSPTATRAGRPPPLPFMSVSFLGLTGPSGVLPQHYSETLIRAARAKSPSLRGFFDIFNHRTVSLFYRAWCKYRMAPSYEETDGDGTDPVSRILEAVVGLATGRLRHRLAIDDQAVFHYAGLFGGRGSAVGLERLLSDYFGRTVRVLQFQGRWLPVPEEQRTVLPGKAQPEGAFCRLGVDATIGERSFDVSSNFALALGPLTYDQFASFMPDGEDFKQLVELTRLYVGSDLDFTVELTLAKEEVPACRLSRAGAYRPRLGCNAWLKSEPFRHDATDAVFTADR